MTTAPRSHRSRREFLCESSAAAAAAGAASVLARGSSAAAADSEDTKLNRITRIETAARQARRLVVDSSGTIFVAADREIIAMACDGTRAGKWSLEKAPRCLAILNDQTLAVGFRRHIELFDVDRGETLSLTPRSKLPALSEESILSSLASDGKHFFAADAGMKTIWKLSLAGETLGRIDGPGGKFHAPAEYFSIALGTAGDLHTVHPGRHRVEQYDAEGKMVSKWGTSDRSPAGFGGCCNPIAVAKLVNGQYVTAERVQPRIKLFTTDGTLLAEIAGPEDYQENQAAAANDNGLGCNRGGFDLASDSHGKLYVLDRVTGTIDVFG